jgi:hypothetical protein
MQLIRTGKIICSKCLKSRSADDFVKANKRCGRCRRTYYKRYNAKRYQSPQARRAELIRTREKYWKVHRVGRMERKRKLILLYGGKCKRCGYKRSAAALDFHHKKRGEKSRTISHLLMSAETWSFAAAVQEAKKCELICSNCHREETYPGHELHKPVRAQKAPGGYVPNKYGYRRKKPENLNLNSLTGRGERIR